MLVEKEGDKGGNDDDEKGGRCAKRTPDSKAFLLLSLGGGWVTTLGYLEEDEEGEGEQAKGRCCGVGFWEVVEEPGESLVVVVVERRM